MDFLCPPTTNHTTMHMAVTETIPIATNITSFDLDLLNVVVVANETFLQTSNNSGFTAPSLISSSNISRHAKKLPEWNYGDFTRRIAIPSLCVFGIIGNILNVIILSKKIREGKRKYFCT